MAELLELLYGARTRFHSARGVLRCRQSMRLMHEAHRREIERVNRRRGAGRASSMLVAFAGSGDRDEERPDLYEEHQRFWWEPPDRLREETVSETRGQARTTVLNGELWWTYTPDWGAISNIELDEEERAHHGAGGGGRFRTMLDPSGLIATLEFAEITADGERLRVRALPRDDLEGPPIHFRLHAVGGTDEFELEIDRDTGIIRRLAAYIDGQEVSVTELEEVALDEEFPEDTFVFVPPPGVEVLPPEPATHRSYTLEEAAAAAPFPVFFINELPAGDWRLRVNHHAPRRRPPMPAHVWLIYSRADGRGSLSLAQRPAGDGGFGWAGYGPPELEQVERGGVTYTVARADPDKGSQHSVAFEREGTSIQLQSPEVDVEVLLALAASLRRINASG